MVPARYCHIHVISANTLAIGAGEENPRLKFNCCLFPDPPPYFSFLSTFKGRMQTFFSPQVANPRIRILIPLSHPQIFWLCQSANRKSINPQIENSQIS
jgi:hypothetical protein